MNRRHFLIAQILSMAATPVRSQIPYPAWRVEAGELTGSAPSSLPEFSGGNGWFNTDPLSRRSLRGHVVLINFWTYSCINSLRPLPYLKSWGVRYEEDGLVVLGVHTPEFGFEKNSANVEWALREFRITYPVVMDNDYRIWRAFRNEAWPAFYLADAKGGIHYRRLGEGEYGEAERIIRRLLKKKGAAGPNGDPAHIFADGIEAAPGGDVRTPETYIGYSRADRFRSGERVARDSRKTYTIPTTLGLNQWGLSGGWEVGAESGLLREPAGKIILRFHSRDLHLVLGPAENGKPVRFLVTLDGAVPGSDAGSDCSSNGRGEVREPRLYQLIRQKGHIADRTFGIEFLDSGVRAFSFTFG